MLPPNNIRFLNDNMVLFLSFDDIPFFDYNSIGTNDCEVISGLSTELLSSGNIRKYPKCEGGVIMDGQSWLKIRDFDRFEND